MFPTLIGKQTPKGKHAAKLIFFLRMFGDKKLFYVKETHTLWCSCMQWCLHVGSLCVWYRKIEHFHVKLNELFNRFTFFQTADIIMYFYRPFSKHFCFIHLVLRNALMSQILMFFNAIIMVRYIFIFWLRNPLNFNDDFWCFFINLWVILSR